MKCPLCETEASISGVKNIIRDNKLFRKYEYSCRNKKCDNFEKVVGDEEAEIPVSIE